MPFGLEWETRGLLITYSGALPAREILQCHERIASDLRFDGLRFAIVDTHAVTSLMLTRADLEEIDAFLRGPAITNSNIRIVFVATDPSVLQVLEAYAGIADRSYRFAVCTSVAAARAMLSDTKAVRVPR